MPTKSKVRLMAERIENLDVQYKVHKVSDEIKHRRNVALQNLNQEYQELLAVRNDVRDPNKQPWNQAALDKWNVAREKFNKFVIDNKNLLDMPEVGVITEDKDPATIVAKKFWYPELDADFDDLEDAIAMKLAESAKVRKDELAAYKKTAAYDDKMSQKALAEVNVAREQKGSELLSLYEARQQELEKIPSSIDRLGRLISYITPTPPTPPQFTIEVDTAGKYYLNSPVNVRLRHEVCEIIGYSQQELRNRGVSQQVTLDDTQRDNLLNILLDEEKSEFAKIIPPNVPIQFVIVPDQQDPKDFNKSTVRFARTNVSMPISELDAAGFDIANLKSLYDANPKQMYDLQNIDPQMLATGQDPAEVRKIVVNSVYERQLNFELNDLRRKTANLGTSYQRSTLSRDHFSSLLADFGNNARTRSQQLKETESVAEHLEALGTAQSINEHQEHIAALKPEVLASNVVFQAVQAIEDEREAALDAIRAEIAKQKETIKLVEWFQKLSVDPKFWVILQENGENRLSLDNGVHLLTDEELEKLRIDPDMVANAPQGKLNIENPDGLVAWISEQQNEALLQLGVDYDEEAEKAKGVTRERFMHDTGELLNKEEEAKLERLKATGYNISRLDDVTDPNEFRTRIESLDASVLPESSPAMENPAADVVDATSTRPAPQENPIANLKKAALHAANENEDNNILAKMKSQEPKKEESYTRDWDPTKGANLLAYCGKKGAGDLVEIVTNKDKYLASKVSQQIPASNNPLAIVQAGGTTLEGEFKAVGLEKDEYLCFTHAYDVPKGPQNQNKPQPISRLMLDNTGKITVHSQNLDEVQGRKEAIDIVQMLIANYDNNKSQPVRIIGDSTSANQKRAGEVHALLIYLKQHDKSRYGNMKISNEVEGAPRPEDSEKFWKSDREEEFIAAQFKNKPALKSAAEELTRVTEVRERRRKHDDTISTPAEGASIERISQDTDAETNKRGFGKKF